MTTPAEEMLGSILSRRSAPALLGPPPSEAELRALLQAAASVPDHGRMRPWRFVVVAGDARAAFGDALREAAREQDPALDGPALRRYYDKAFLGPALIAVAARPRPNEKVPAWEQEASAACAGYAIALGAHLLGLGAIWKSTIHRDGERLRAVLDLGEGDRLLGWVNIGRPATTPPERKPADLSALARTLGADGRPRPFDVDGAPAGDEDGDGGGAR